MGFSAGFRSMRMFSFLSLIILSFTFNYISEARPDQKMLPSAVVIGTVYCSTCFQEDFSKTSHFISGASVAVECGDPISKPSFHEEVKTNEHGEFKVHLPFSVSKHVKKIEGCSVKLISSNEPYCAVASTATSSSLHLKSRKHGTHIFSAGFFTFKPLKQPILCNQKPSFQTSKKFKSIKSLVPSPAFTSFPPPIQDPPTSFLPPIDQDHFPALPQLPQLPPLPELPPLPTLPGFPTFPPMQRTQSKASETSQLSNQKVVQPEFFRPIPQIPFLPSPPITFGTPLPPNPFQPPSVLPPNPFRPSPPATNFPPIPGTNPLTPSPGRIPFPFPPLPFQPSPGIPPAASSTKKTFP